MRRLFGQNFVQSSCLIFLIFTIFNQEIHGQNFGRGHGSPSGLSRGQNSWRRNPSSNYGNYDEQESQGFGSTQGGVNLGGGDELTDDDGIQQSVNNEDLTQFNQNHHQHSLIEETFPSISTTTTNKPVKLRSGQPEVTTSKGTFIGKFITATNGKKVAAFYGIPFAKPPIGDLRFKKPVASSRLTSPFGATELPNACVQESIDIFGEFSGERVWNPNTNISEDCLYINIWIPQSVYENRDQELVSVLFWIHGGGYFSGSNSIDVYNGAVLASEEDVVVVSSQYRLGPLGFLYFGTEDAPGNMGLWDQNLALKWVHENIDGFGGNPESVTLIGESAGSAAVGYHLLSPQSKAYFKRGVMMSGLPGESYSFVHPNVLLDSSYKLAELAGCDPYKRPHEVASCLRNVESQVLIKLQWRFFKDLLVFPFVPTLDGQFLTDTPNNIIKNGEAKRADLIVGTVQDEGTYFILYQYLKYFHHDKSTSVSRDRFVEIMREVFQNFQPEQQDAIINYYTNWENPDDGKKNQEELSNAVGDAVFVCPNRKFADAWTNRGLKLFYYHFTQRIRESPWADWMGVMHGDDIHFIFGHPLNSSYQPAFTSKEKQLTSLMMRLIANFAKVGTPSDKWERYTSETPIYLDLNATIVSDATSSNRFGPMGKNCAFWNKILPEIKNKMSGRSGQDLVSDENEEEIDLDTRGSCNRNTPARCQKPRKSRCGGVHGGRGFHESSEGEHYDHMHYAPLMGQSYSNLNEGHAHGHNNMGAVEVPLGVPKKFGMNRPVFGSGHYKLPKETCTCSSSSTPQQVIPIPV